MALALASGEDFGDITHSLSSLQFNSSLTDDEKTLVPLRKRAHALTTSICAQATYFVSVLNEIRQIRAQIRQSERRPTSRLMSDVNKAETLVVGVLGCGRLGSHLASCLLTFGEINPQDFLISTRRPETLVELKEQGVQCVHDNVGVSSRANVLFLCVLPSQLPAVSREIRDHIPRDSIIYSCVGAKSAARVRQLLSCCNDIIRPEFEWDSDSLNNEWNFSVEILETFNDLSAVEKTCPVPLRKNECVVRCHDDLAVAMTTALVNRCTSEKLSRRETVDILNAVLLGHTRQAPLGETLQEADVAPPGDGNQEFFPRLHLGSATDGSTLRDKLLHSTAMKEAFSRRYCSIFRQYTEWKNHSLQAPKKQFRHLLDGDSGD